MESNARLFGALLALALGSLLLSPSSLSAQSKRFDEFLTTEPMVGDVAPDFRLMTLEGEDFQLSAEYAERPVVIEFGSYT